MSSTSILSKPTGPKELLTILAIAQAAITERDKSYIYFAYVTYIKLYVTYILNYNYI